MGSQVGVHTEDEVKDLTLEQRAQLKERILQQLQNSPEIRAIINEEPRLLTTDSRINKILRRELRPIYDGLKKK